MRGNLEHGGESLEQKIAKGAKIGEVASVNLHEGVGTVTMRLDPKYARLYRDATLLMRPKTNLQDMTVEVTPGTAASGRLPSGATVPIAQTAPNINFDQFLAGLDAETRIYLQELLAGAGEGFGRTGGFRGAWQMPRRGRRLTDCRQRWG